MTGQPALRIKYRSGACHKERKWRLKSHLLHSKRDHSKAESNTAVGFIIKRGDGDSSLINCIQNETTQKQNQIQQWGLS